MKNKGFFLTFYSPLMLIIDAYMREGSFNIIIHIVRLGSGYIGPEKTNFSGVVVSQ
jgi:hypothetical protein